MRLSRSRLAKLRYAAGFNSARSLAETLGLSPAYLHEIEGGKRLVSARLVELLVPLLGVDAERITRASSLDFRERHRRIAKALQG